MAEVIADQVPEARQTPRRGKAKAKAENIEDAGLYTQRPNTATPEPSGSKTERGEPQVKERKKPRKLEMRSVVLEEPVITLDTRVESLERQFQALSSRVDAVEVRQVRRPTAATYRRSSSTSTRATSVARPRRRTTASQSAISSTAEPRPSLAEQLRESQRLRRTARRHKSSESIEEIPRSALTVTNKQARQVALTGQYNIPLPANLTADDVRNLRSGLTAAGSIARSLASALTSSRDGGSGTTTPRAAAGTPAAGASRSKDATGSVSGPADGSTDHIQEENVPGAAGAGAGGDNASSTPGYRQPEEKDVLGAENASKSWKSFIASAVTDLVTSAAKDAAVEIQSAQQAAASAGPSAGHGKSTGRRRNGSPFVRDAADAASATESSKSSTARQRPEASRTSSRASSYRAS